MFWTIVMHEIRARLLSFRFLLVFLATTVLLLTSLLVMSRNYQRRLAEYDQAHIRLQQQGMFEKRPNPLSVFAMGLEDLMTRSMFLESEAARGQSKYTNPFFRVFLKPDLVFVVVFIMSFLSMIASHDAISGEREEGTLGLMFSNRLPRDTVLLGKWAAAVLVLSWPLLLALIVALLISQIMGLFPLRSVETLALLGILLVSLIYVSAYVALSMLISTSVHRSSISLIVSLFVWTVLVLVIPSLSPHVSQLFIQAPSSGQIKAEMEAKTQEFREAVRASYSHEQQMKLREELREAERKIIDRRRRKLDQRDDLALLFSRISPAPAYLSACIGLAGTGVEDLRDFRAYWRRFTVDAAKKGQGIADARAGRLGALSFQYKGRTMADRLKGILPDLASIVLFNVLCFVAMFAKFLRSDLV